MLTRAAMNAGLCAASIVLAALSAKAADGTTQPTPVPAVIVQVNGGGNTPNGSAAPATKPGSSTPTGTVTFIVDGVSPAATGVAPGAAVSSARDPAAAATGFFNDQGGFQGGVNVGTGAAPAGGVGSVGMRNPSNDHPAERRKVRVREIPIVKKVDKASPVLAAPAAPAGGPGLTLAGDSPQAAGAGDSQDRHRWDQRTIKTRQSTVIHDMVPPPGGANATALAVGNDGQAARVDDLTVGGIKGEAGAMPGQSRAGITDGTSNTIIYGEKPVPPPSAPAPRALTSLGSLNALGSVNNLFLNSRGGDQGTALLLPAVQAAREAARRSGNDNPGCTVGCQNNLNAGKPPGGGTTPMESMSLNYTKMQLNNLGPGGGAAAPKTSPTPQIVTVAPAAGGGTGTSGPHVKVFDGGRLDAKPAGGVATPGAIRAK